MLFDFWMEWIQKEAVFILWIVIMFVLFSDDSFSAFLIHSVQKRTDSYESLSDLRLE